MDWHWWRGAAASPDSDGSGGGRLIFNNNVYTTMNNDFDLTGRWEMVFQSGATTARTISGSVTNTFYDNGGDAPTIKNESSADHAINFPIKIGYASGLEISIPSGPLSFGGAINTDGRDLHVYGDTAKKLTLSGVVSGSGKIIVEEYSHVEITGASTVSGNIEIDEGEFWLGAGGTIGSGTIYVGNGGQQADTAKLWISDSDGGTTLSNAIIVNDGNANTRFIGGLNSSGVNTFSGSVDLSDDVVFETVNDGDLKFSGPINMSYGSTDDDITISGDGDVEVSGSITAASGAAEILHTGAGVLYLSGDNATSVDNLMKLTLTGGGTLRLATASSVGDIPGSTYSDKINFGGSGGALYITINEFVLHSNVGMTIADGVKARFTAGDGSGDDLEINGVIADGGSNNGVVIMDGPGALRLYGNNTYGGATLISNGVVVINSDTSLGTAPGSPTAGHLVLNGGTLYHQDFSSITLSSNRGISLGAGGGTLQVYNSRTLTYGGIIAGANGLTKEGTGQLTLNGTNSYSGATSLNTGEMVVNGAATNSAFTVASGTVLGGTGAIGGVTLTGQVAPGTDVLNGIGTLTVASLEIQAGSSYRWEVGDATDSADRDVITVGDTGGGTVTINATSGTECTIYLDDSEISNWNAGTSKIWTLIDAGALSGYDATDFTLDDSTYWGTALAGGAFSISNETGNLVLYFTPSEAPPELVLSDASLAFTGALGTEPPEQTFSATNTGGGTLVYTNSMAYGTGWGTMTATVTPGTGTAAAAGFQIQTVALSRATSVGTFHATNTLAGNQSNGDQDVAIVYTITNLPNSTALSVSDKGTVDLTVNWTRPGAYNVMVVRRQGANPDPPTNGADYDHNDTYGPDNRNKVIYAADAGSSDTDSGLTPQTQYNYAFFTENYAYYSPGSFLVTTTLTSEVDGNDEEWVGTLPGAVNSATIDAGEFLWRDKGGEQRNDSGHGSDVDIREFRMRADADDVYFMIRYADITDVGYPYVAIAVDTDQNPSDAAMNWIADDSDTGLGEGYYTNGNAAMHYPERNIIVHTVPGQGQRIELHADDGSTWYAPPTHGNAATYFEKDSDEIVEFKIARADLGLTGSVTARLTVASYFNNTLIGDNQWANDGDTTANYPGSDAQDTLSVLPYGVNDAAGNYGTAGEETDDGDLDTFFDVTFDVDGIAANTLPVAPDLSNTASTLPTNNATVEQGRLTLHWPAGSDADDAVTSYFVELSTSSTFNGGENYAIDFRANTRHTELFYDLRTALADDTYYWRVRSRDLGGMLSGHTTNTFTIGGADDDTSGPTPTIIYIGPNYTGSETQTSITDADLVNSNELLDIVVQWTDPSGVFLTNSAPYANTNVLDTMGRVIANWDVMVSNSVDGAQQLGYDKVFTNFLGSTGDGVVTTIYYNAFSLGSVSLDDSFFLTVSAEDNDNDRGTYPDPQGDGDPIPHDRAITTNSQVQFTVTDNDTVAPVVTSLAIAGDSAGVGIVWGSELISGAWSLSGHVVDAISGVNVNTGVVTGADIAPYVQIIDPSGVVRLTEPFDDLGFDDGGATGLGEALSHQSPAGISAAFVVSGVWTARVVVADNDEHREGDRLNTTNEISFGVPTFEWDAGGGANRDWSTAANWTYDAEPSSIHTAHINGGHTGEVTVTGEAVANLYIGDNGVSETGSPATGTLHMVGGQLRVGTDLVLGENNGDRGTLLASNGVLTVGNDMVAGMAGAAYMTVTGTAVVAVTRDVKLGTVAGGHGSLTVGGGAFTSTNFFLVGAAAGGTGSVSIVGGQLIAGGGTEGEDVVIGAGGVGLLTVRGGTLQARGARDIEVGLGAAGTGTVTVSGSGQLLATAGGDLTIADGAGAAGTVTVSGGLLGIDGTVEVGTQGSGTLNLSAGTITNAYDFFVGAGPSGVGTVYQTGGALSVHGNRSLYVGARSTAAGTEGRYTITDGTLTTEGSLRVGLDEATGTGVFHVVGSSATITIGDGTTEDFELRQNGELKVTFDGSDIALVDVADDIILGGALTISNSVVVDPGEYVIVTSRNGSAVSTTFAATNWLNTAGEIKYGADFVSVLFTPDIDVLGTNLALVIPDNDNSPSIADGSDFGEVVRPGSKTSTFTITNNHAVYELTLSDAPDAVVISGPQAASFVIAGAQPGSPIAAGGSDTFAIEFTPAYVGVHTAYVSIASSDIGGDEDPYNFTIHGTGTLPAEPIFHATDLVFGDVTNIQMTLSWTPGSGENRIVVARAGDALTAVPRDATSYGADAAFGSGDTIAGGEYVVYNGLGSGVTVTSLSPGTTYYFTVFEYNGIQSGINYFTVGDPLSGSQTTATYAPVITGGVSTNITMSENGHPTDFSLTLSATDPDPGDTLTWSIRSAPFFGTASVSGTGASRPVSYSPPGYYAGSDSFVVQVKDSFGNTDAITVNITVAAVNKPGKTVFIFE